MAYWLFCQACKQWSKFPTPLSEDKNCSYCNSSFITSKNTINSSPVNVTSIPTKEFEHKKPPADEVPKADESNLITQQESVIEDTTPEPVSTETSETVEKQAESVLNQPLEDTSEVTTLNEIQEHPDPNDTPPALETEDSPVSAEIDEGSPEQTFSASEASSEVADEPHEVSASQESPTSQPEPQEASAAFETTEVSEASLTEETPKKIEPIKSVPAPSTAKIIFSHAKPVVEERPEKPDELDSPEALGAEETQEELESPTDPEPQNDQEAPETTDSTEEMEISESQDRIEEPDASAALEIPEDQDGSVIINSNEDSDNLENAEALDEPESSAEEESPDTADTNNIPAHRIYMENRRRKKRRRNR